MGADRIAASYELIDFVRKYVEVQEKQLGAIRVDIQVVVEKIMTSINDISKKTDEQSRRADEVLVKPSLVESQNSGDAVKLADATGFQSTTGSELDEKESATALSDCVENSGSTSNKIRRLGGKFTKHMEAMTNLNSELKELLFDMMGALSADDVIRQKLEHVVSAVQSLHVLLAKIAQDPNATLTIESVNKFKSIHLTEIYKNYTCEEEKEEFHQVFGRPVGVRKAS